MFPPGAPPPNFAPSPGGMPQLPQGGPPGGPPPGMGPPQPPMPGGSPMGAGGPPMGPLPPMPHPGAGMAPPPVVSPFYQAALLKAALDMQGQMMKPAPMSGGHPDNAFMDSGRPTL